MLQASRQAEDKARSPALSSRLRLNRLLLEVHLAMDKAMKDPLQAATAYQETIAAVAAALPLIDQCCSSLVDDEDIIAKVFNLQLWKRFTTAAPPRALSWIPFATAAASRKLQLSLLSEVCTQVPLCSAPRYLYLLCDEILAKRADLVVRAQFVNITVQSMKLVAHKGASLTTWVQNDIAYFGAPKTAITADCHDFLVYGARGIIRRLRTLLSNRSRARRRLVHCFEDSSVLVSDGETLDEKQVPLALRGVDDGPRYLSRWALDWTLAEMQQWLLVGFELQMYEQYEFPVVWWYLDSLAGSRRSNQGEVLRHNEAQKQKLKALRDRRNKGPAAPPAPPQPTYHSLELEAQFSFIRGMVFVMALLVSTKKLEHEPAGGLASSDSRYYRRLMPFLRLATPTMANYRSFSKSFMEDLLKAPQVELTKRALQLFADCQGAIGKLLKFTDPAPTASQQAVLKQLLRAAVMNGLKLGTWKPETTVAVAFDFSVHPHYPVLDFVAAK